MFFFFECCRVCLEEEDEFVIETEDPDGFKEAC